MLKDTQSKHLFSSENQENMMEIPPCPLN